MRNLTKIVTTQFRTISTKLTKNFLNYNKMTTEWDQIATKAYELGDCKTVNTKYWDYIKRWYPKADIDFQKHENSGITYRTLLNSYNEEYCKNRGIQFDLKAFMNALRAGNKE